MASTTTEDDDHGVLVAGVGVDGDGPEVAAWMIDPPVVAETPVDDPLRPEGSGIATVVEGVPVAERNTIITKEEVVEIVEVEDTDGTVQIPDHPL